MFQMRPPMPPMPPGHHMQHPGFMHGGPPMHAPPQMAQMQPPNQQRHQPPPPEDEPPTKKAKTEDDLMPEDEFLKRNKVGGFIKSLYLFTPEDALRHSLANRVPITQGKQGKWPRKFPVRENTWNLEILPKHREFVKL